MVSYESLSKEELMVIAIEKLGRAPKSMGRREYIRRLESADKNFALYEAIKKMASQPREN